MGSCERASTGWTLGGGHVIDLARPEVVGILNLTPDSFSDGGSYASVGAAVAHAADMARLGAAMIDIGGESTRPGASRIEAAEQIARVVPVIRAIRGAAVTDSHGRPIPISIDTTRAPVALAAIEAGADAINDVSAGEEDPVILALAAERGCGLVLMHRLAPPDQDSFSDRYERAPVYADVVKEVAGYLGTRAAAADRAGVRREAIVLDPGLGFGKTVEQNLELIRRSAELASLAGGYPIVSGLSRKSFVARASGLGPDSRPSARLAGTIALTLSHAQHGARLMRVHDVGPIVEALRAWSRVTL
ncbi:MAG: dihydropteroate synthase [Phycisphaerales bacterium]|nr:dihydropteroate synthase [Phycisphaerales bacterium]